MGASLLEYCFSAMNVALATDTLSLSRHDTFKSSTQYENLVFATYSRFAATLMLLSRC
jgi:hypothetical protein